MYKTVKSPQGRTSRTIAEERNEASHFEEGPKYDYARGIPVTKDMPQQDYKENVTPKANSASSAPSIEAPFTIKGS